MRLKIDHTRVLHLVKYPCDPLPTQTLLVSFLLTPPLAEKLRCREVCYTEDGVPRKFEGSYGLVLQAANVNIQLDEWTGRCGLIDKFQISMPKKQTSLYCKAKLHFDGEAMLSDWLDIINDNEFTMVIAQAQSEFDFSAEQAGAEPVEDEAEDLEPENATLASAMALGEGTHQAGSRQKRGRRGGQEAAANDQPEEMDTGCVLCNNELGFAPGSDSIHENGTACTRVEAAVVN